MPHVAFKRKKKKQKFVKFKFFQSQHNSTAQGSRKKFRDPRQIGHGPLKSCQLCQFGSGYVKEKRFKTRAGSKKIAGPLGTCLPLSLFPLDGPVTAY